MMSGGRRKEALLGDALEAVIAAVYIDGGFDAARSLITRLWAGRIASVKEDARDPKTALQEWAQARGMTPPHYTEQARSGPDHQPVFTVAVRLDNDETEQASAGTKRAAEQAAARALLARMEQET
jgi:ribonuclease-3